MKNKNLLAVILYSARFSFAGEALQLPAVEVNDNALETEYKSTTASAGTKSDLPALTTPVAVQAVTNSMLVDQGVNRLQDALANVSGVRSENTDIEGYVYKLRGFTSTNLFRNGLMVSYSIATVEDTANVDRVEVVKGPASMLYGRIDPGGVINIVTKRPLASAAYSISQQLGSHDFYRTEWDATGPISDTVNYRFVGAYQDYDSFRDFQSGHRTFLAPSVNLKLNADTDLLLDAQYLKNRAQSDTGFPSIGAPVAKPASIPLARSFQEPNDPLDHTEGDNLGYELKHRFNSNWSVTNRLLYSKANLYKLNVYGLSLDEESGELDRSTQYQLLDGRVLSTNVDLLGQVNTGNVKHNILIGADYLRDRYDYTGNFDYSDNYPINIYNPIYGAIPATAYQAAIEGVGGAYYGSQLVRQLGFYGQDQIEWSDKWVVLFSGRYDRAQVQYGSSESSPGEASTLREEATVNRDNRFSPRTGILYRLNQKMSIYSSYSQSFGANNGISSTGEKLAPELGTQYEVGFKFEPSRDLSLSFALYQLTKSNISTPVLSTPDPDDVRTIGKVRSRGVEFDASGRVTANLKLVFNYAYTQTCVIEDNSVIDGGYLGNDLDNVPRQLGHGFMVYDLNGSPLGWHIGGGFTAAGRAWVDRENSALLPGYATVDAYSAYTGKINNKLWTAQLNLNNVLNKHYFYGADNFYNSSPRLGLWPGEPFNAMFQVRLEF